MRIINKIMKKARDVTNVPGGDDKAAAKSSSSELLSSLLLDCEGFLSPGRSMSAGNKQ
jgi:hypothetical protein